MEVQTRDVVQLKEDTSQKQVRYEISGKVFLVQPVYRECGAETVTSILFRLMEDDFAGAL